MPTITGGIKMGKGMSEEDKLKLRKALDGKIFKSEKKDGEQ